MGDAGVNGTDDFFEFGRGSGAFDEDDDEVDAGAADDRLYLSIALATVLFVFLLVVFDLLRTRLWWVYEPRLHHAAYRRRTPAAPGRGALRWVGAVMRRYSDEDVDARAGKGCDIGQLQRLLSRSFPTCFD